MWLAKNKNKTNQKNEIRKTIHIPIWLPPAASGSHVEPVPHWTRLPAVGSPSLLKSYAVPTTGWQQPYPISRARHHLTTATQTMKTETCVPK